MKTCSFCNQEISDAANFCRFCGKPVPVAAPAPKATAANVGETLFLGSFLQRKTASAGKTAIEWLVLAKEDRKALVISKYALDYRPFHTVQQDVTWADCSLRAWLNADFYGKAFTAEERARILPSAVKAGDNPKVKTDPGRDTVDRIFLLSVNEAERFFRTDAARKCKPTDYAKAKCPGFTDRGCCDWWLRSPAYTANRTTRVPPSGSLMCSDDGYPVFLDNIAVRPAMWIQTE